MTISNKDRKKLWALAGNQCAICKKLLVNNSKDIIGEEAHICGKEPGSERYDSSMDKKIVDSYDNLILLCANDHTMIDKKDNGKIYTVEYLKELKARHEELVKPKEVILDENELEESILKKVYKKNSFSMHYDYVKEAIEEFYELHEQEQLMLYYLIKKYDNNKFNVPKVANKGANNKEVIYSLLNNNFLMFKYEISLLIDTDYGLNDLNSNIDIISQDQFKYNWELDHFGKVIYECYINFSKPSNLDRFNSFFK